MKKCEKCDAVVNPKTGVCDVCEGTGVQKTREPEQPEPKAKKKKR